MDCSRVFNSLEDVDVGAGDERRAGADQDDGVCSRVVTGALDCLADAFGNAGAQRVDGRISMVMTATRSRMS